jgi:hypothetical protein
MADATPHIDQKSTFSLEQISEALNSAADEILEAVDAPDSGLRDALNLLVNAGLHYLEHPGADLSDVVSANYSAADLATVLSWIGE